jgi:hypothetical protein
MIPIGFDPVSGALVITDNGVFPARSLTASVTPLMPDHVQINDLAGRGVQSVAWVEITSLDGSRVPASMADALAYLQGEFAKNKPVGETFGVPVVAGADLAQGQPVAVSRASGQLLPARADTYTLAFVAGVASADTAQGFATQPAHGAITLPDWSGATRSFSARMDCRRRFRPPIRCSGASRSRPSPALATPAASRRSRSVRPMPSPRSLG